MDQSCLHPATPTTKFRSMVIPPGVCVTSGWNWRPHMRHPPRTPAAAANSQLSVVATADIHGGMAWILSPCDIHTRNVSPRPANSSLPTGAPSTTRIVACPNSRSGALSTRPPSAWLISWKP